MSNLNLSEVKLILGWVVTIIYILFPDSYWKNRTENHKLETNLSIFSLQAQLPGDRHPAIHDELKKTEFVSPYAVQTVLLIPRPVLLASEQLRQSA